MKQFTPCNKSCLLPLFFVFILAAPVTLRAQTYHAFFEEAYQKHPTVPRGLLEAVAYSNTRMKHVQPVASCQEIPTYYGVMGLVEDGKGYFNNSLERVAELSGYSVEQIKSDPRTNILAYAAAYAILQTNKRMANQRVETHQPILGELSEIPVDGDVRNEYARDQQFYGILQEMEDPHSGVRSRRLFDYNQIFGRANYRVLSASRVVVEETSVRNLEGDEFTPAATTATCTATGQTPDYAGALFSAANSRNYSSRGDAEIQYITIHTIQGSYASAIAWFKNRNARVSAHYVIRASDGQITQMVCEKDRAYHVKQHNSEAIGIEHEGFIDDGLAWYTNEMYESSAALVRDICKRYDIDPRKTFSGPPTDGSRVLTNTCYKVKGHQHFKDNDHIDPGPYWDWERYYRLINPEPNPTVFTKNRDRVYDSGGKNGNYGDLERQTYLIAPIGATRLTLTFEELDMEGTQAVPFDFIDVYDGRNSAGRYLGRFSGSTPPGRLTALSGAFFLEFRSDCQVNKGGFTIRYTSDDDEVACSQPQNVVVSDLFPTAATVSWDAVDGALQYLVYIRRRTFEDNWTMFRTEENRLVLTGLSANAIYNMQVRTICGSDTSAITGKTIQTPNMPRGETPSIYTVRANQGRFFDTGGQAGGYSDNEHYVYRIIPPDGGRVDLRFTSFITEEELDKLTIYDGLNLSRSPNLGTFSGANSPGNILSTGNGLTLVFESDNRTTAAGWTAFWRSAGGTVSPENPEVPDTPDPDTDPVASDNFDPELTFPRTAPATSADLAASYTEDFTLKFDDDDNSGRGMANRFYSLASWTNSGWQANTSEGFFYDDFEKGLRSIWTSEAGNWRVENGILVQNNLTLTNTNLYTDLTQTRDKVYLYHWKARMTGETGNRRHGIHIFASDPSKPDRGNSYFIWIRESDGGDFLEIYETINDQFTRRMQRGINIEDGKVHDYKTIYNPSKGRIEVYINNDFAGSWVDPSPLRSGKAISLRSGNCVVSYDEIEVFQSRGSRVNVSVGSDASDLLRPSSRFRVSSLVVDRNIDWSPITVEQSSTGTNPTQPVDPDPSPNTGLADSYNSDFKVRLGGVGTTYYLPSDRNAGSWGANRQLGFVYDDFSEPTINPAWTNHSGSWRVRSGTLQQTNDSEGNSNLFVSVEQNDDHAYLYHFRARLRSDGDNRRFGIHFFCSEGNQTNRGDSYLMWFRSNPSSQGRVEVYRSEGNQLPRYTESSVFNFRPNQWYDIKITYNPATGEIQTFVDDQPVLKWTDTSGAHKAGSYLSLRTGNALVEFDDLRVYQAAQVNPLNITVGRNGMLRYQDQAKLYLLTENGGVWSRLLEQSTRIR